MLSLWYFLLFYLIHFILPENLINEIEGKNYINIKIKGNNYQQILGSKDYPDLIYVNGNITELDDYGSVNIENGEEINEVTLIWNSKLDTCNSLFKSSLNIIEIDLSNFDTSIVTSMASMFEYCENLKYINFSNINTSSVIELSSMFGNCKSLISIDLSNFNTSKVKFMDKLFYGCSLLTSIDITNFNTSNVESISSMFNGCHDLVEIDLSKMDVSSVSNMENLFKDCYHLTSLDLSTFDTYNVVNMRGLFFFCESLVILDISKINTFNVENMSYMFYNCKSLTSLDLRNFLTYFTLDMSYMFYNCISLSFINVSNFDTVIVNNMQYMFYSCISLKNLDVSSFMLYDTLMDNFLQNSESLEYVNFPEIADYISALYMFSGCSSLKSIDFHQIRIYRNMGYAFSDCISLTSLNLSMIDTHDAFGMVGLFHKCNSLKILILSNWVISNTQSMAYMFYDCKSLISLDLSKFDTSSVSNMNNLFFNCIELKSLNLGNFDTRLVTDMNSMFYGCTSLKSVNLSSFNTEKVKNMKSMFFNCIQLESLNLSSFNTREVTNMNMMFSGCVNLKYINFSKYDNHLNIATSNIFYGTHENLIVYINDLTHENIINLIPELSSMRCMTNDYSLNSKSVYKVINDNKICINECYKHEVYKYEYNSICYIKCPKRTSSSLSNKYFCELEQADCIEEYPFLIIQDNYCFDDCNSEDFFNEICIINNHNIKSQSILITNIINGIEDGTMDSIIENYIYEGNEDIIKFENNILYQITSTFNQRNITYENISTIDLGECESIIKEKYNILQNETLLIFKMERYIEGLLIPFIEYEIFHPITKKRLNLNEYEDLKIHMNIPVSINESILYKYDLNNSYYQDICNITTEENGVDITLYDRKNNYIKNNMYFCTIDCEYLNYNKEQKKVTCLCKFHPGITLYKEIKKEQLINSVINIKRKTNLNIMKCYNLVFSEPGIIKNFGNYIIAFIVLFYILSAIFFYFKGYDLLCDEINEILNLKNIEAKEELKIEEKLKENQIIKKESVNNIKNSDDIKFSLDFNNSKESLSQKEIVKSKIGNEKPIKYLNYEINIISYERAKRDDKRTFFQYYISLLLLKNIFIFGFNITKDYNPFIIKICIFFFLLSLNFIINAMFFNDHIMSKIYENEGVYNFSNYLPQIIYSIIIASIFGIFIKRLILSQRNILEIKYEKNKYNIQSRAIAVIRCLIIKFVSFFIISFIFLILFWYYLSCFCAVYKNTQKHLIKNSLFGLIISFLYPFILCLIPGIFRIPSLNKPGKCLYNISKIIQIL